MPSPCGAVFCSGCSVPAYEPREADHIRTKSRNNDFVGSSTLIQPRQDPLKLRTVEQPRQFRVDRDRAEMRASGGIGSSSSGELGDSTDTVRTPSSTGRRRSSLNGPRGGGQNWTKHVYLFRQISKFAHIMMVRNFWDLNISELLKFSTNSRNPDDISSTAA